ncbi:hypothetical protein [Psychroflexus torquis]|nr:hypothetical protein [Psychroflexus torquis]
MKKLLWFTETNINQTIKSKIGFSFNDKMGISQRVVLSVRCM